MPVINLSELLNSFEDPAEDIGNPLSEQHKNFIVLLSNIQNEITKAMLATPDGAILYAEQLHHLVSTIRYELMNAYDSWLQSLKDEQSNREANRREALKNIQDLQSSSEEQELTDTPVD